MITAGAIRSRSRLTAIILAAFVACALALWASPAKAHSELEASTPAEGASVSALAEFSLTFGEGVTPEFSTYTLTDATKASVKLGTPRYDTTKTTVTVPVAQMIGGGDYTIGYSILSVDGHKVAGTVHFTSTAVGMGHEGHGPGDHTGPPPSGMPMDRDHDHEGFGVAADDAGDSGKAIWFALGGALLGAVIVAVIAWLIRRRGGKPAEAPVADDAAEAKNEVTETKPNAAKATQDKPKRAPKKSDS